MTVVRDLPFNVVRVPEQSGFAAYAEDYTVGGQLTVIEHPCTMVGLRFVTMISGGHTLRAGLWHPNPSHPGGQLIAVGELNVPTGSRPTEVEILFDTPYEFTLEDIARVDEAADQYFWIGVYETTGSFTTRSNENPNIFGIQGGGEGSPGYCWFEHQTAVRGTGMAGRSSGGWGVPNHWYAGGAVPVDPLFEFDWDTDKPLHRTTIFHGEGAASLGQVSAVAGDRTCGNGWFEVQDKGAEIRGVEFYTHILGPHTITAKLWNAVDGTPLRTKQVNCSGPGTYRAIFASPYVIGSFAGDLGATGINANYRLFMVSVREDTGSYFTRTNRKDHTSAYRHDNSNVWCYNGIYDDGPIFYRTGDGKPNTYDGTNYRYPVSPLVVPSYEANIASDTDFGPMCPTPHPYSRYLVRYVSWAGQNWMHGYRWVPMNLQRIYGARLLHYGSNTRTTRCKLWRRGTPDVELRSGTVQIVGPNVGDVIFDPPYTVQPSDVGKTFEITRIDITDPLFWTDAQRLLERGQIIGLIGSNTGSGGQRNGVGITDDQPTDTFPVNTAFLLSPLAAAPAFEIPDKSPPVVINKAPIPNSEDVEKDRVISFDVIDYEGNLVFSSIEIYVRGALIWKGSINSFHKDWINSTYNAIDLGYHFDLVPERSAYYRDEEIKVRVKALDSEANSVDDQWSFFAGAFRFKIYPMLYRCIRTADEYGD